MKLDFNTAVKIADCFCRSEIDKADLVSELVKDDVSFGWSDDIKLIIGAINSCDTKEELVAEISEVVYSFNKVMEALR